MGSPTAPSDSVAGLPPLVVLGFEGLWMVSFPSEMVFAVLSMPLMLPRNGMDLFVGVFAAVVFFAGAFVAWARSATGVPTTAIAIKPIRPDLMNLFMEWCVSVNIGKST